MALYEPTILYSHNSLDEWDQFVGESPQGCIFSRSWWLQAVCPNSFEILTLRKDGKIITGMPITMYHRLFTSIRMPLLTQTLGVLLPKPASDNYEKNLSNEMDILCELIQVIPKFDNFSIKFHYNFTNWLPFYWNGYNQTTRYTYVIPDLTDLDKVFSVFAHSKRKNINKAKELVTIHTDISAEDFYNNHVLTLGKQKQNILYEYETFKRIYDASYKNGCGKTWCALDEDGNIHATIFVIYDNKSAYYLISSIDPDYRNSGSATLLVKEAIAYVSKYTNCFDFEGSMIHGVENSFRKFGAIQKPYFEISKRCLVSDIYDLTRKIGREILARKPN